MQEIWKQTLLTEHLTPQLFRFPSDNRDASSQEKSKSDLDFPEESPLLPPWVSTNAVCPDQELTGFSPL
jgi:hypothetical protein